MVFKRRDPQSFLSWVRQGIYPKTGWRRAASYMVHRLRRLPDSPHRVARGLACGVFVSFSPMFGFHFVYAALLAWLIRGNILASLIGTFFGNPLTFPLIATLSLWIGRGIFGLGGGQTSSVDFEIVALAFAKAFLGVWQTMKSFVGLGPAAWDKLGAFFHELFVPYFIGGLAPGCLTSFVVYSLAVPVVRAYQARRQDRMRVQALKQAGEKPVPTQKTAGGEG
ncbi:MAG: DUF2062 domain-containing protein [Pseudomonadota bacterium]